LRVGRDHGLPGARAPGSLSVSITGNVYSGNAVWTGSATRWAAGATWCDAAGGPTAAPGTDNVLGHDSASFAGSGDATAIDLTGANPNLQALSFSGSNYTLSNGSLTLQSSTGAATITVSGNKQTIDGATNIMLASPAEVVVYAGAELDINAGINELGGSQSLGKDGGGTLVLSGTNTFDGGTQVLGGTMIIESAAAVADGSNLIVGDASLFGAPLVLYSATIAGPPPEYRHTAAPVPEPGTAMLFAMALFIVFSARQRAFARNGY